jgi:hypothetical protein
VSTNYYLDEPHTGLHLGKWAAGRFHGYAPPGIDSFEQWAAQFTDGARPIYAESGYTVTPDEMIATAKDRRPHAYYPHTRSNQFVDQGVQFSRYEFC